MSKSPSLRRIQADVRELALDPSDRYHAAPLEDDMFEWHFTIRGADATDFKGGVYHGRILLPPEYPFKPPHIVFLTPSGRFETGTKVCLSFSAYHPELWQPAWGIRLILEALISFLPTPTDGAIGSLDWTSKERKRLAQKSTTFCCPTCGPIIQLLPEEKETDKRNDNDNDSTDPNGRTSKSKPRFQKEIEQLRLLQIQNEATATKQDEDESKPEPKPERDIQPDIQPQPELEPEVRTTQDEIRTSQDEIELENQSDSQKEEKEGKQSKVSNKQHAPLLVTQEQEEQALKMIQGIARDAAANGDISTLTIIAKENNELLNFIDKNGWRPIHEVARSGKKDAALLILRLGPTNIDINALTANSESPLFLSDKYHGKDHPLSQHLRSVGAICIGPSKMSQPVEGTEQAPGTPRTSGAEDVTNHHQETDRVPWTDPFLNTIIIVSVTICILLGKKGMELFIELQELNASLRK